MTSESPIPEELPVGFISVDPINAALSVQIRTSYTEFKNGNGVVKVHGVLKYKVGEWRWGDALEFWPEPLSLVGTMVSIVPLTLRLQIYSSLGWMDKVDAINAAIEKTTGHHEFAGELS